MTGEVAPRGELVLMRIHRHIREQWRRVQNPDDPRRHPTLIGRQNDYRRCYYQRRRAIDAWLDGCEVALKFTCPQFYDENGKPFD